MHWHGKSRVGLAILAIIVWLRTFVLDMNDATVTPKIKSLIATSDSHAHPELVPGKLNDTSISESLCRASVVTHRKKTFIGSSYYEYALVASSNSIEGAITLTDEFHPFTFVIHRAPSNTSCEGAVRRRAQIIVEAEHLRYQRNGYKPVVPVPLRQSAFFRCIIDHRFPLQANGTTQTRRVQIDAYEAEPNYFVVSTRLYHPGLIGFTLELGFETKPNASRTTIDLGKLGWTRDDGKFQETAAYAKIPAYAMMNNRTITKFGMTITSMASQPQAGFGHDDDEDRPCDYESGDGEWVYNIPEGINIREAPKIQRGSPGRYRLFGCSESRFQHDYQRGLALISKKSLCALGDSNMRAYHRAVNETFQPRKITSEHVFYAPRYDRNFIKPFGELSIQKTKPPQCEFQKKRTADVLFMSQGSHQPFISKNGTMWQAEQVIPSATSTAKCSVGVQVISPYYSRCPGKFGIDPLFGRNAWRIAMTNEVQDAAFRSTSSAVAGVYRMSLSIADVSSKIDSDCVHLKYNPQFPFYEQATRLLIATVGASCLTKIA